MASEMASPELGNARTDFSTAAVRTLAVLRELSERYQEMVVKDPEFTSKIETVLRLASYIIPGRFGGGWEVAELAYCISNLYALMNDCIITRKCPSASTISKCTAQQQVLLWSLSVLDCLEVVVEMYSKVAFNEPGKWGMVILVQMLKAILRSLLVFKLRAGLLTVPAVPAPDRKKAQALHSQPQSEEGQPVAWKAPRTGKIIRSLQADSSIPYSQLHHHVSQPDGHDTIAGPSLPIALQPKQLLAEALYIARPLVHIFSMFVYQQKSWKPWLISLGMDLASLKLHGGLLKNKSAEKSEILRRRVVLLLYLLRSPFYDHYTKNLLLKFLSFLASTIPLLYLVVDPVLKYLPVWQQIYSYNWMT